MIPIILEYIDKVSPDELDEKTREDVLKYFIDHHEKQINNSTKKRASLFQDARFDISLL